MKEGRGRIKDLLDGAYAGIYTLPEDVLEADRAIDVIEEAIELARDKAGHTNAQPDEIESHHDCRDRRARCRG